MSKKAKAAANTEPAVAVEAPASTAPAKAGLFHLVREDGTAYHFTRYNPKDGKRMKRNAVVVSLDGAEVPANVTSGVGYSTVEQALSYLYLEVRGSYGWITSAAYGPEAVFKAGEKYTVVEGASPRKDLPRIPTDAAKWSDVANRRGAALKANIAAKSTATETPAATEPTA